MVRIDVCIVTFQRPTLLLRALWSVAKQEATGIAIRLVVVDNDCRKSALQTVVSFGRESGIDLLYVVEPARGIAAARNRALDSVSGEYVAFLDDDEEAAPYWLSSLLETSRTFNADIVFGPVFRLLPSSAPTWAHRHPAFARITKPTGSSVRYGGAGNVLIRLSALGDPAVKFNANFGLTGGEDFEFFCRLHQCGKRMTWCQEAEVTENVPLERTRVTWLCARAFRGGQSVARVFLPEYRLSEKASWLVVKCSQVLAGTAALPVLFVLSFSRYVILLTRVCSACGQLSAVFGKFFLYNEYESPGSISAIED
jgi:succinoglycan biosynthesis protein ExoM